MNTNMKMNMYANTQPKLTPFFSSLLSRHIFPTSSRPFHQCSVDWELTDLYGSYTTIYIKQLMNDELFRLNLTNNRINYQKEINKLISEDRINWSQMSANPSDLAIDLLSKNPDKIEWRQLIRLNTSPRVWELMKDYPEHMERYSDDKYGKQNFQQFLKHHISSRPENKAIEYLLEFLPDDKNYRNLSSNPCEMAIDLLASNPSKIHWDRLSSNPSKMAIDLLVSNPSKIHWDRLSRNPSDSAIDLLISNPTKISYKDLSFNRNDRVFDLLNANREKIKWLALCVNTGDWAIDLLDLEPKKIDWYYLCRNKNPRVIDLVIKHKKWFDKYVLLHNNNEIELIETGFDFLPQDERYYHERTEASLVNALIDRPEIFEFDYKSAVREKHYESGLFAELLANRFHPKNIPKFFGWGFEDFDLYEIAGQDEEIGDRKGEAIHPLYYC